jgi:hypothetical protein
MALSNYKSIILNDILKFDLIIKGQGVFIFSNNDTQEDCYFKLYNEDKTDGLKIKFTKNNVKITKISSSKQLKDKNNKKGLIDSKGAYYWFSIDSQNQKLQAGVGEPRIENIVYTYQFANSDKTLWETNKSFLEDLVSVNVRQFSRQLQESVHPELTLELLDETSILLIRFLVNLL